MRFTVIVRVLAGIASRGIDARARDFLKSADVQALRASLADVLSDAPTAQPPAGGRAGRLSIGSIQDAWHSGLPWLWIPPRAAVLKQLAEVAAGSGAHSIQTSPGRSLLFIGLDADSASELTAIATVADLSCGLMIRGGSSSPALVRPPANSAKLSTRELAPTIAEAAGAFLDGSVTIHVSGCTKGCAHPDAAALTFVGRTASWCRAAPLTPWMAR